LRITIAGCSLARNPLEQEILEVGPDRPDPIVAVHNLRLEFIEHGRKRLRIAHPGAIGHRVSEMEHHRPALVSRCE
jgi:hypothetical protein